MQDPITAFRRGCGSKLKHPNPEAAQIHLENLKSSSKARRRVKLEVYLCRFCHPDRPHWHVGRKRRDRVVKQ